MERFFHHQKINYAALNDGDDDDEDSDGFGNGKASFDTDDEDDLLDNTGITEPKGSVDMFDTLKSEEDPTPKKPAPTKRKLGNKPEVVKPPTKRTKKAVVITSDSDANSPIKVNVCIVLQVRHHVSTITQLIFFYQAPKRKKKVTQLSSDEDDDDIEDSDSDFNL